MKNLSSQNRILKHATGRRVRHLFEPLQRLANVPDSVPVGVAALVSAIFAAILPLIQAERCEDVAALLALKSAPPIGAERPASAHVAEPCAPPVIRDPAHGAPSSPVGAVAGPVTAAAPMTHRQGQN